MTTNTQKDVFAASYAKNNFGHMLDTAQRKPVTIQKKGRNVAVVLSYNEYERLETLDDTYWSMRAEEAKKEGVLSTKESEDMLNGLTHAQD